MTETEPIGRETTRLRKAISDSKLSLYRIAKDAKVPWASMHRFARGGSISLVHFEKLCQYLGLRLTKGKE